MDTLILDLDREREEAVARERQRLQGAWEFVSGIRPARMVVDGDAYTVTFRNGDVYRGTFALDPTAAPKMMDLAVRDGPDRHRGKTSLAIYELDGDRLVLCPAEPGTGNRPRAFPDEGDTQHLCLVFRREPSRPVS